MLLLKILRRRPRILSLVGALASQRGSFTLRGSLTEVEGARGNVSGRFQGMIRAGFGGGETVRLHGGVREAGGGPKGGRREGRRGAFREEGGIGRSFGGRRASEIRRGGVAKIRRGGVTARRRRSRGRGGRFVTRSDFSATRFSRRRRMIHRKRRKMAEEGGGDRRRRRNGDKRDEQEFGQASNGYLTLHAPPPPQVRLRLRLLVPSSAPAKRQGPFLGRSKNRGDFSFS